MQKASDKYLPVMLIGTKIIKFNSLEGIQWIRDHLKADSFYPERGEKKETVFGPNLST